MAGPLLPFGGAQASRGLPSSRPGGKFTTSPPVTSAPNIKRAFSVSEGGGQLPAPSLPTQSAVAPTPPAFGASERPAGLTGGPAITGADQVGALLSQPGRGLSARFQGPPGTAPGIAGPAGGGLEETDPLDELLRGLIGS